MKTRLLCIVLWLAYFCPQICEAKIHGGSPSVVPTPILVVAGQSNIESAVLTGTSGLPAGWSDTPLVQIWNQGSPGSFIEYSPGNSLGGNWGPEVEYALDWMADNPGKTLYIVKRAITGTQLAQSSVYGVVNSPIDWSPESVGYQFDITTGYLTKAKAALVALGKTPKVVDILYGQGEADSTNLAMSNVYAANLADLISHMRSTWGDSQSKVVLFRLGCQDSAVLPYSGIVKDAQGTVAAADGNAAMVETNDLGFAGSAAPYLHWSAASQITLGDRLYQAAVSTYPSTSVAIASTFTAYLAQTPINGTPVITIKSSNSPLPSATFAFVSGDTAGFTIDGNTGDVTVSDGTQLVYASKADRVIVVAATNGVNTVTTTLTVHLQIVGMEVVWNPSSLGTILLDEWNANYFSTVHRTLGSTIGNNIFTWNSLVSANSPTQNTVSSQPNYSATGLDGTNPEITFNGLSSGDFLTNTGAPVGTGNYYFVIRRGAQTDGGTSAIRTIMQSALSSGGNKELLYVQRPSTDGSQTNILATGEGSGAGANVLTGFTNGYTGVVVASFGATTATVALGSGSPSTANAYGTSTTTVFAIGGDSANVARRFGGGIAEILHTDGTESPTLQTDIINYLAANP